MIKKVICFELYGWMDFQCSYVTLQNWQSLICVPNVKNEPPCWTYFYVFLISSLSRVVHWWPLTLQKEVMVDGWVHRQPQGWAYGAYVFSEATNVCLFLKRGTNVFWMARAKHWQNKKQSSSSPVWSFSSACHWQHWPEFSVDSWQLSCPDSLATEVKQKCLTLVCNSTVYILSINNQCWFLLPMSMTLIKVFNPNFISLTFTWYL